MTALRVQSKPFKENISTIGINNSLPLNPKEGTLIRVLHKGISRVIEYSLGEWVIYFHSGDFAENKEYLECLIEFVEDESKKVLKPLDLNEVAGCKL